MNDIYRIFSLFSYRCTFNEGLRNVDVVKSHSTPATLNWLQENFELCDGVCIPRCEVYMHYIDFCNKNLTHPVNAASFGKVADVNILYIPSRYYEI